jgi:hypothetical protein
VPQYLRGQRRQAVEATLGGEGYPFEIVLHVTNSRTGVAPFSLTAMFEGLFRRFVGTSWSKLANIETPIRHGSGPEKPAGRKGVKAHR